MVGREPSLFSPRPQASVISLDTDLCYKPQSDRKGTVEDLYVRTHQQSQTPDAHSVFSASKTGSELSASSPVSRRRSSRARSTTEDDSFDSSSQSWVDDNQDDAQKPRRSRKASRRMADAEPLTSPVPSPSVTGKEPSGFMPKLSRILEGKESRTPRRRRGSTVSSIDGSMHRVSRPGDSTSSKNRIHRQNYNHSQRVERNLASLQNPSLISVLSGLTQDSHASNESNATITQQSYDKRLISKRKPTKDRKRLPARRVKKTATMSSPEPDVFQFMEQPTEPDAFANEHHEPNQTSSSSSSSTSSSDSEHRSLPYTTAEPVVESPPTSPASMRKLPYEDSHEDDDTDSDNGPVASTRPTYQPSVVEATNEDSDREEQHVEKGQESADDSEEEDNEPHSASEEVYQPSRTDRMAVERIPPPRVPSASSSHHSDRHTRRMRQQEQAIQAHILQNPQPHRGFHFNGAMSPQYPPSMPLYDPYRSSGSSPASFTHTTYQAPPVAHPPPSFPPQQAIGYHSPAYAPVPPVSNPSGYDHQFAMTARPPMAPSVVAQPAQLQYPTMHPPPYQTRQSESNPPQGTMVGYELLAKKLSQTANEQSSTGEEPVVPMYRKFGNLNHRVLLHLQDEIGELEEELRYLDEYIAQCAPLGHQYPASRRGDARYGGEMHHRRTELLGRIYLKLGQYSTTPASYDLHITQAQLCFAGSEIMS